MLLLPDGHRLLEAVDSPFASRDRLRAMWARNGHDYRRLSNVESTCAVRHRHPRLRPPLANLVADFPHLRLGHFRVGLVVEACDGAAARVVAHHTRESADRSRPLVRHRRLHTPRVEWIRR